MHVLVAGAGWLGSAIAEALRERGDRVTAVRRSDEGALALRKAGFEALALDLAQAGAGARLPDDLEAIVSCPAAGDGSVEAYRRVYLEVNRTLLAYAGRKTLRGYVYTSSTGVFGQTDGGDVDESAAPAPAGPTSGVLVEAERLVLAAAEENLPACVLRYSGLYGPGRTALIDRVKRGVLALGPGDDTWMNFCHRDDAVGAALGALDRGRRGGVYHGSDAFPTRRRDVVQWISDRLGIEAPRLDGESDAVPGGRRGAHRRILAYATRRELGLALSYPSFREGLEDHILEYFE